MPTPILATKLYIPPPRPKVVPRPRLVERLNEGLQRKLTLISASAGFGKTTLVGEWLSTLTSISPLPLGEPAPAMPRGPGGAGATMGGSAVRAAWLSLDAGDNDPICFLTYLVAALQTLALPHRDATQSGGEGIAPNIGAGVLAALQSPQPPPTESILTALLNEITAIPDDFILVLDDYHVIEAQPVDQALTFLLEHLPPPMHLVIATREDPHLPLARLRARGQLTELRAADLRFTPTDASEFLNNMMGL